MGTLPAAKRHIEQKTRNYAKQMGLHQPIEIEFRELANTIDAMTTPYYRIDPNGNHYDHRFKIVYNTSFIDANKKNLQSKGVTGVVVHELAHARHFIDDFAGYNKAPHTDPDFKKHLKTHMGGTPRAVQSAMKPDVAIGAFDDDLGHDSNPYDVAPAWLANYWVYVCPVCGFVDAYITNRRARRPVCEVCPNKQVIAAKLTVDDAARLNMAGERQIQQTGHLNVERSVRSMVALLKKYLTGEQKRRLMTLLNDPRFMQRACRPAAAKKKAGKK
ncbi:MAG: hypothetical protein PHR28_11370 [candidate division Zixibacteria bacterium]|jgi:hypothetical protein|nr:hypothetical protein [candidate division Zixibacteria bacterium]